jgi:hypothetical protein
MVERIPSKRPNGAAHPDAHDEKTGRFVRGHKVYSRKERGDRRSRDLKDAILHGAVAHGSDGKGKNGLNGYLEFLASKYPKNYSYLLGKLLPFVVRNSIDASLIGNVTVSVTPIAAGKFLSLEQMSGIVIDGHAERVTEPQVDDEQDNTTPRKPFTH